MKLKTEEIIFLTYLTHYNIKVIRDYSQLYETFEEVVSHVVKNFKYDEKAIDEAQAKMANSIDKLSYYNIKTVSIYDGNYPEPLKSVSDAPPLLFYWGELKSTKGAAVVGSRVVSKYAQKITYEIVDWLKEADFSIVSGLALGIDSLAHQRALINRQYTIAVLPNSLDSIYPQENYRLANEILDNGGCLISESNFGINRGKKNFVQRNRIQAGLSQVVIPIEMGVKSGTMHTIKFAKRYNRNIGLFKPTPILSELENYEGINYLINSPSKNQYVFMDKTDFDKIFKIGDKVI